MSARTVATDDVDREIRQLRRDGELLGPLVKDFGAEAVVRALGSAHIAASLLPPELLEGCEY